MSKGVASLRCPRCNRLFLSMPDGPGALVTCPHCAQSAPMSAFATTGAGPGLTALPVQRRVLPERPVAAPPQAAEPPAPPPAPAVEDPPLRRTSAGPFGSPAVNAEADPAQFRPRPRQAPVALLDTVPGPEEAALQTAAYQARYRQRWLLPTIVFAVAGGCALWMVQRDRQIHETVASSRADEASRRTPPLLRPLLELPAEPEVRRAAAVTGGADAVAPAPPAPAAPAVDIEAANDACPPLLAALFAAPDAAQRAALIENADEHMAEVERFFAQPGLTLDGIKPVPTTSQHLVGLGIVPLYQVFTSANRHGALLRLVPKPDGGFLLDWPLFGSTHERRLETLLKPDATEPAWIDVALRRSHGLDLPEAVRKRQLTLHVQGSADASLMVLATADRDTPVGRFLDRQMQWGKIYVARLLLQGRALADGLNGVAILDCEGATAAPGERVSR